MAQIQDDSKAIQITMYPEGIFYGTLTYSPGQVVAPNTNVTITYQVQNTGGTGSLWGGLYDTATPPNLLSGYWTQAVTSTPVTKTATINAGTTGVIAQLLVGHFE